MSQDWNQEETLVNHSVLLGCFGFNFTRKKSFHKQCLSLSRFSARPSAYLPWNLTYSVCVYNNRDQVRCFICSARWLFPVVGLETLQCHLWKRDPEEESSVQQPLSSQRGEALPGIGFRNAKLSPEAVSRYSSLFNRQARGSVGTLFCPSLACLSISSFYWNVLIVLTCRLWIVDGNWSEWSPWEECTRSCGRGNRTRTRTCNNPSAQHGGRLCEGTAVEIIMCNIRPCPGENLEMGKACIFLTHTKEL